MAIRYTRSTLMRNGPRTQSPARAIALVFGSVALAMLLLIGAMLVSRPAHAQQVCAVRDTAVTQLESQFDEQIVGRGLVDNGKAMVELFVSETGTWTVVVTDTNRRSCIVASGMSWTRTPLLVGDPA